MFDLILRVAEQNEQIRAVYMNGSRANPAVPEDFFQDYDIVYVVSETRSFYEDETWIDCFGERLYMQMPGKMDVLTGGKCNFSDIYCWLILFKDGNRLDLHVESVPFARNKILRDKLCVILLDKDNILPSIPATTDIDYHVKKPSESDFMFACNEFWWCLNNVAKGLWRREITYVMDMLNYHIRPQLLKLLTWKIGFDTDFFCSVGKSGKYLCNYLTEEIWSQLLNTYSDAVIGNIWKSVFIMCDLFDKIAVELAGKSGYCYNYAEAKAGRFYLERVYKLPPDAKEFIAG
jgi:aminoglycoside 6-adenylyltransferase